MSKKYFVISDIHSFFVEMKHALKKAGFRVNNKEHILIVLGDLFDRGPDSVSVYKFIKKLPKYRRILIRGNHEQLYLDLLNKRTPDSYDYSNGTVKTFCQIADVSEAEIESINDLRYFTPFWQKEVVKKVADHEITKWLLSDEWINYYELDRFIFVHSFVPLKLKSKYESFKNYPSISLPEYFFEYDPDWRNSSDYSWQESTWGCPWSKYQEGMFTEPNKTIVCGHWHTSDFYKHLNPDDERGYKVCAPIYYSDGLIGIDGGVTIDKMTGTLRHPQNVLIIDEHLECYDGCKQKIKKPVPNIQTITVK